MIARCRSGTTSHRAQPEGLLMPAPEFWAQMMVDTGPTLGWSRRPLVTDRLITSGTSYTVQPWDRMLLISVAAPFSVNLPSVATWMLQPYGLRPLRVKDAGGFAGANPITLNLAMGFSSAAIPKWLPYAAAGLAATAATALHLLLVRRSRRRGRAPRPYPYLAARGAVRAGVCLSAGFLRRHRRSRLLRLHQADIAGGAYPADAFARGRGVRGRRSVP